MLPVLGYIFLDISSLLSEIYYFLPQVSLLFLLFAVFVVRRRCYIDNGDLFFYFVARASAQTDRDGFSSSLFQTLINCQSSLITIEFSFRLKKLPFLLGFVIVASFGLYFFGYEQSFKWNLLFSSSFDDVLRHAAARRAVTRIQDTVVIFIGISFTSSKLG